VTAADGAELADRKFLDFQILGRDIGLVPLLVVSDGTLGLPKARQKNLPNAQQQRCITHKVRGLERYLSYAQLPQVDPNGQPLKPDVAKRQRSLNITSEAYQIYEAESLEQARQRLQQFV
jgi:putative transposase